MKTIPSLIIAAVFASLTFAVWAYLNRPTREPPWPARIQGFAFSPFRMNEDPTHFEMPTDAEIDADLALLEGKVNAVRTYSVAATLADVPDLADKHGINVTLGAWLDSHLDRNEEQLKKVIDLADSHQNVVRVVIGNEVLLRGDLPLEQLEQYLDRARAAIGQPVGTAETWYCLARASRARPARRLHRRAPAAVLGGRAGRGGGGLLPGAVQAAAEGLSAQADRHRRDRLAEPRAHARVGGGLGRRTRRCSCAASSRAPRRSRSTTTSWRPSTSRGRRTMEGAVGSYWGVYDVNRQPKFAFTAPIVRVPEWHILAAVSVAVALVVLGIVYLTSDALRNRGRSFLAHRGVRRRNARGVGDLRLHAAVHDRLERDRGRAAAARHAGGDAGAARRGARVGRGALGGVPAPAGRRLVRQPDRHAAEGLDPCAGLQRAAGTCSSRRSMRSRASTTRTSKCWSSTTTPRTRPCGARSRRIARSSGRASASSTSRRSPGFKAGALNYALERTARRCRGHRRDRQRLRGRAGLAART